jgi:putative oxidoreductase
MLLGVYPRIGIVLLVLFLLGAALLFHNYWKVDDAQTKHAEQLNFMKNMALVGALLMLLALPQPSPLSLWAR